MVNETILGGIRIAIAHKATLKDAMQSFYNAGYKKEEVEEAAKIIFEEQIRKQKGLPVQTTPAAKETTSNKTAPSKDVKITFMDRIRYMFSKKKPVAQTTKTEVKQETKKTPQKPVEKKSKNTKIILIILLSGFLILLLGVMIALFMFKDTLF